MKQYLRAVFDNDRVEATVTKFEEWCGELATAHYSDTVSDMIEDDRPFQLNRRLGPFLCASASPSHTPSLWPIVHKVT